MLRCNQKYIVEVLVYLPSDILRGFVEDDPSENGAVDVIFSFLFYTVE